MDLSFDNAPKDLMRKFIDVLVRLPDLRTLELLSSTRTKPIMNALKRKCANFPSIREITVGGSVCPDFMKACPNLESVTFRDDFGKIDTDALSLYGAGLKRVKGVLTYHGHSWSVECESLRVLPDPRQLLNALELQLLCGVVRCFRKSRLTFLSTYVPPPVDSVREWLMFHPTIAQN